MNNNQNPLKETQISQEFRECNVSLDNLQMELDDLEKRLEDIMLPFLVPPKHEKTQEKSLVKLAEQIKSIRDRIVISVDRVRTLRDRIEL